MKTIKEMIEIMAAYDNGADIEIVHYSWSSWKSAPNPTWDWGSFDYRVKEQKKTITIEKWLITNSIRYDIAETSNIKDYLDNTISWIKVKLLDTYEVEL